MSHPTRLVNSLAEIVGNYDAIISDVWGVIHNGARVWPDAMVALEGARKMGKTVVLLTNAPRLAPDVAALIRKFGGTETAWDGIVSSGAVTRELMAQRGNAPFYHLGPHRDTSIYDNLDARRVELKDAAYVLCTGLFNDEAETVADYRDTLNFMLARKMPMICANPDLVVERGHKRIPCAGALADAYEHAGGPVIWVGKPHPLVYEAAHRKAEELQDRKLSKSRILGIGDALRTDVAGAIGYGIDCLMVLDGIHADELELRSGGFSEVKLQEFLRQHGQTPRYAIRTLT